MNIRNKMFEDFEKIAKDLETKTGAKISTVEWSNQFRFYIEGDMVGWWGIGGLDIFIARKNPSPHKIEQAYESVNKWISNFPEKYKDYMKWKSKDENEFNQEVERRRNEWGKR